jgi:hypothetical protein
MARRCALLVSLALGAGLPPIGPVAAASPPAAAGLDQCQAPASGTYVVLGSGQQRGEPTALLLQERWFADGRIEGVRYLREGRRFRADRYHGQVKADAHCWAVVERQGDAGSMGEVVALDRQGRPRASLAVAPSEVLPLRYIAQAGERCRPEQLDGLVTSQQQGQSWLEGRWQPNAVVQREWWQSGVVQGLAVSSYAGRQDRATYSGRLELGADCLGRMTQRDAEGATYTYRVVVLANGGGYAYLQTDPDDLTLGLLQHQDWGRRIMGRPGPEGQ